MMVTSFFSLGEIFRCLLSAAMSTPNPNFGFGSVGSTVDPAFELGFEPESPPPRCCGCCFFGPSSKSTSSKNNLLEKMKLNHILASALAKAEVYR